MAEPYQLPVARIWRDRQVVGAGFLAPRGVVVTCAHLVNDALGRGQIETDEPTGRVRIDLPWAAPGAVFQGTVVDWRPPIAAGAPRPTPCVDIAVLQLDPVPPSELAVSAQAPAPVREDTGFRVMGFPDGSDAGWSARGTVRATDADGWHLVEADRSYGRTMEPGFSGAPAIADKTGSLLGMIDVTNPDERRGALIPAEALMRAWPPLAEPYRGLDAFREEDEAYFFGRAALADRLWRSFERHPVTLLTGPSGAGKSSLLNAGFLPQLRRQRCWRLVRFRPGDQPLKRLASGITHALDPGQGVTAAAKEAGVLHAALIDRPDCLLDYAEALHQSDGERLCLIVDQLEETFTLARSASPAEHRAFLAALTAVARQSAPITSQAVLGLRSDFQTDLLADRDAADLVAALDGEPTVQLRALRPVELEAVIRGPLSQTRLDVDLEDGLLTQIVSDLTNADALPLLEFALTQLWAGMTIDRRGRRLGRSTYEAMGGIAGALAQRADAALDDPAIGESEAKRLFVELVQVGASSKQYARRPCAKADLDLLDERLWPVAQRLAHRRLLVTTDGPGVDVVHEALFRQWGRLAGWIEEGRDLLLWRQRVKERCREWDQAGRHPDELLSGNTLDEAKRWLVTHSAALNQLEKTYIDASRMAQMTTRCRQESDALWDRLELSWGAYGDDIPDHELHALLELARATPEVRQEFLLSSVKSEHRARRLGRAPRTATRAALGLDADLAMRVGDMLLQFWHGAPRLQYEQLWASVSIGLAVAGSETSGLAVLLVERAVEGIAGTTNPSMLQAYGEVVRTFGDRVDGGQIKAAARALVERAVEGIAGTIRPSMLQAYGEVVRTIGDRVDGEAARALVERAAEGIAGTTAPQLLQA